MSKISEGVKNPKATIRYVKHRLQYQYLRLRKRNPESIEFYKSLQDTKIREGEAYPRDRGIGKAQIEFLRRVGLHPNDDLLDIGCGDLRGGRYMIGYQNNGSYTGMDISEEAIATAREHVYSWNVDRSRISLSVNNDLQFNEFDAGSFDWVFANSVLTHLPEPAIRECFTNLGRILRDEGIATLSYQHSDTAEVDHTNSAIKSNVYRYPFERLSSWAAEYGLLAEYDPYDEHPYEKMRMLKLQVDT